MGPILDQFVSLCSAWAHPAYDGEAPIWSGDGGIPAQSQSVSAGHVLLRAG